MNAFHGLLPPPVAPPRLPLPGPSVVVDAARLRRRARARHGAAGAAGALTLTVVAALALHPASGAERLRPAHLPTPSVPPAPATTPPPRTVARDDVTPVTPVSPTKVHPTPSGVPSRPTAPPATRRVERVVTRTVVSDSATDCEEQYAAPDVVLCDRASGPAKLWSGEAATFVFEVCAGAGRDQTVHYPGTAEVSVEIRRSAREAVWQNASESGPGAHDVTIPAGHCLRYDVRWNGKDTGGHPLPPGGYVFSAVVAANLTYADSAEVSFTVS